MSYSIVTITLCAFIFAFIVKVDGVYVAEHISSGEVWATTLVHKFGMAQGGVISVDYSVSVENNSFPYDSYVLLLVTGEHADKGWYNSMPNQGKFVDDSDTVRRCCNRPSLYRDVVSGSGTVTYKLDENTMYSDRFSVYALQCVPSSVNASLASNNRVTTSLEISMVNLLSGAPIDTTTTTNLKDVSHLSISLEFMPRMYIGLLIVHCFMLFGMCGQLYIGTNYRRGVRAIHLLFLITELFYCIYLISMYSQWYYFSVHGFLTYSHNLGPAIFSHIQETLMLTSMLLLSLGYTLVRDTLSSREIQLTAICLFIFFINGFITASCDAYGSSRYGGDAIHSSMCRGGYSMGYLVRTFIYLGAILGMNYNVTALRVQVAATPWSATTCLAYARSKQFQMFRYVFLLFLLLPLIVTILDVSLVCVKHTCRAVILSILYFCFVCIVAKYPLLARRLGPLLYE